MRPKIHRTSTLLITLVILTIAWFAVPSATQEGANEGFILFSTDRDNPSPLELCPDCEEIYAMSPDGSNATRITENNFNDKAPVWSDSKKTIAFHSNRRIGRPEIFLMNLDGTDQRLVASLGQAGAQFPSFSHNGNELCFSSQTTPRDIFIVDVHGMGLTNLTAHAGDDNRCDWSPKGNDILFTSNRDGNLEIYVMNADGTTPVRLTTSAGSDTSTAWSPKADRIAFESTRDGNAEIYVMNADGSDPMRLTNFPGQDTKPSWSPLGDRLAFHRQIDGHLEVHTMNADGTDVTKITSTESPGFSGFPSWAKWSAQLR
jgi:Tol biopolymer transport system component